MQSSRPGSLTSFAKGISELLPLGIATGKLVGGNCPTYEARVVYLDRFDSRSIRALFECKLSTLCTLIYCHDLSCSISIHVKERFVQKYSSHVSITVPQATCTQGHRFTSSCQCAKDRPFCVYILMFFSLRLSYTRNKMFVYIYVSTYQRFSIIYMNIMFKKKNCDTSLHGKKIDIASQSNISFWCNKNFRFSGFFSPEFPRAHDLQKHFIIQLCQERAIHLTRKNASLQRIVTTAWSNVEQWPLRGEWPRHPRFFFGRSTMVLTLCDSKDT